eukprot:TRINITY_DN1446_c0_g1_i2.p1 TRINITY_DN1446_c0_g1~~TRINITY_DN1446_c0_g1_i2.p1  ORF type:complete len:129 (+),score=28.10 TRINITY_DN1446_c0_g1_i2:125-511(+)
MFTSVGRFKTLAFQGRRNFNIIWGPHHERPILDRVVSTPSWPVPYYQRIFKAYPIRERKDKASLLLNAIDIDDTNWYQTKEVMRNNYLSREALNYIDNHWKSKSFIPLITDVKKMVQVYVYDLSLIHI